MITVISLRQQSFTKKRIRETEKMSLYIKATTIVAKSPTYVFPQNTNPLQTPPITLLPPLFPFSIAQLSTK